MALATTTNRVSYAGNDVTTVFSFPYYFLAQGDLVVIETDSDGVETTKTITTHYTVSGAGESAGGSVTMLTAPATGVTLVIYRSPSITQGLDLTENNALPAESVEEAFDRAAMIAQRTRELTDRTIGLSDGFVDTFDTTLPADLATANATLVVNATADGWAMGPTTTAIANAETNATAAAASASAASSSANAAAASAAAIEAALPFKDVLYKVAGDSPVTVSASNAGAVFSVNCTSGAVTLNLPAISGLTGYQKAITIVKSDSSVNKVTIARNGTDTINGATSLLLESQNHGVILVADTDGTPDDWSVIEFGSPGAGGGGSSIQWSQQGNSAPVEVYYYTEVFTFDDVDQEQSIYTFLKVPNTYVSGGQINLRSVWYTGETSGNVLFQTTSTLLRVGTDQANDTTNQHTSTNAATTVNGTANVFTAVTCDITDSSGTINSVAVSAGDFIIVKLTRKTSTDTAAGAAYLCANASEVTYV